mmetsp:Transcript_9461/g.8994  ORF Transcript_9461/g.8994 Transcript_9461/m.8994 type:complete len:235 (+) Transcript_9461:181-885(+)
MLLEMYFLHKGNFILVDKDHQFVVTTLQAQAFYGDYQILLGFNNNYTLLTGPRQHNWCLSIKAAYFTKICAEFPKTRTFMIERAIMRRNHFRKMEKRRRKEILKQLRSESMILIRTRSGIEKMMRAESHYSNDLIDLDPIEIRNNGWNFRIFLRYIHPIIRLHVSTMKKMMSDCGVKINTKCSSYEKLYELAEKATETQDIDRLEHLYNELKIYLNEKKTNFYERFQDMHEIRN